jgi:RsmE family RNA methyltransferase
MNSLVIFKEEIVEASSDTKLARITGQHLRYLEELHDLEVGRKLKLNVLNGPIGYGEILNYTKSELTLKFSGNLAPIPLCPISLIVAVPRPQTQKKIIHLASSVGIKRLIFVRCANTEKSYLSSKSISVDGIFWEMIKGLEQSGQSLAPDIFVAPKFNPFVQDELPKLIQENQTRILFDTTTSEKSLHDSAPSIEEAILAFGPELGWNDHERVMFKSLGFITALLGARILRSETAVALALGRYLKN